MNGDEGYGLLLSPAQRQQAFYQGLLGLGGGVLAANRPSLVPGGGTAPAIGQGLLGFQGGMAHAQDRAVRQGLIGAQYADLQRKAAEAQQAQQALAGLNVDDNTRRMLMAGGPPAIASYVREQTKQRQPPAGYQPTPTGLAPIPGGPQDPTTIAAAEEARYKATLPYRTQIAEAGRPSTNVKVETKTGESLAKEVGAIASESRNAAMGALDALNTTQRMSQAMTGANLGPTASLRTQADRFAEVLGIAGQSTQERLANTRQVVKGLAELSLAARKSLKGQGQVSDFEGRLLERAASGQIDDLTAPELKTIIDVTERLAKRQYNEHGRIMKILEANPNYKELAPFYAVPGLPEAPAAPAQPAAAPSAARKGRYNPSTGKIEWQ